MNPVGKHKYIVALDDADCQLRRAKGQLRVLVIGTDNKLLRALHRAGYQRIRQAILGNLTQGASKVRAGTGPWRGFCPRRCGCG
jgi:hypothetical protein